jgi:hypothetical protein
MPGYHQLSQKQFEYSLPKYYWPSSTAERKPVVHQKGGSIKSYRESIYRESQVSDNQSTKSLERDNSKPATAAVQSEEKRFPSSTKKKKSVFSRLPVPITGNTEIKILKSQSTNNSTRNIPKACVIFSQTAGKPGNHSNYAQ